MTAALSSRLERIHRRLGRLYGDAANDCFHRLRMVMGRYGVAASPRQRPRERDQGETILVVHPDAIEAERVPPLAALTAFLDDHLAATFRTIHLLPFFPASTEDRTAVIDHRAVDPRVGSWEDVARLARRFDLMVDLILNHCSTKSPWFLDYTAGVAPARDYFIEVDPAADFSAVARPQSQPVASPAWTRDGERHVWTTFGRDRVDLQFANPDVLFEFLDILLSYIARGTDAVRLPAVPYLWKRPGSPCVHLEETHEIIRLLRDVLEVVAPHVVLIADAHASHTEALSYVDGAEEADMAYHDTLPALLLHALCRGDATYLREWIATAAPPPPGCSLINYTAAPEGVWLTPLEGRLPGVEIEWLLDGMGQRGGVVTTADRGGASTPYELDLPYFDALAAPGRWGTSDHLLRFLTSQTVALELQGIPAVYFHALTATPANVEDAARTGNPRTLLRKTWKRAELDALLSEPASACRQVFQEYCRRLGVRRRHAAFHPQGAQRVLDLGSGVFAVERVSPDDAETVTCVSNFTAAPCEVRIPATHGELTDLLAVEGNGTSVPAEAVRLGPYETRWLAGLV